MDSWEDEDYEVPSLAPVSIKSSWEDEEEEEEAPAAAASQPNERQLENAKKATEAEAMRIAAAHEAAEQANETPEQRRLRERLRVEEADHGLTEELFGGGNSSASSASTAAAAAAAAGIEGVPLRTLQDHVKLALDLSKKLNVNSNKSANVTALLKELLVRVEGKLSLEEINELFHTLNKARDTKVVAENKKKAILKKQQEQSKKRKEEQAKKKAHKDLFGGNYDDVGDQHDEMAANYEAAYDDFM